MARKVCIMQQKDTNRQCRQLPTFYPEGQRLAHCRQRAAPEHNVWVPVRGRRLEWLVFSFTFKISKPFAFFPVESHDDIFVFYPTKCLALSLNLCTYPSLSLSISMHIFSSTYPCPFPDISPVEEKIPNPKNTRVKLRIPTH